MRIVDASEQAIREASEAIQAGRLVGMPTETVYGIAASALNEQAILQTFAVKGRPAENPLIVHLPSMELVESVADAFSGDAKRLAEAFWPGPLTMVLPKKRAVSDLVTGGLSTVAVRVPAHPVALSFLAACGVPISAPSANRFMGLSPTRAEDIDRLVANELDLILDGGPCQVGVESTVLDCTSEPPVLLRPGGLSREEIERLVGTLARRSGLERRSPGLYKRHYAPVTRVRIVPKLSSADAGIVLSSPTGEHQLQLPKQPGAYASALYAALHRLDAGGFSEILVEAPPQDGTWEAVWDRILKASHD